jgi:NTP pyrophosphatase (non-canonical NTP hydrolase)
MRFLEEALELAQAEGMTEEEARRVAAYVWGRPVGETGQEVGGVMVTLAAFCHRREIDLQAEALREFDRIDSPEMRRRIFDKQAFKRAQGLTSDGGFRPAEQSLKTGEGA